MPLTEIAADLPEEPRHTDSPVWCVAHGHPHTSGLGQLLEPSDQGVLANAANPMDRQHLRITLEKALQGVEFLGPAYETFSLQSDLPSRPTPSTVVVGWVAGTHRTQPRLRPTVGPADGCALASVPTNGSRCDATFHGRRLASRPTRLGVVPVAQQPPELAALALHPGREDQMAAPRVTVARWVRPAGVVGNLRPPGLAYVGVQRRTIQVPEGPPPRPVDGLSVRTGLGEVYARIGLHPSHFKPGHHSVMPPFAAIHPTRLRPHLNILPGYPADTFGPLGRDAPSNRSSRPPTP